MLATIWRVSAARGPVCGRGGWRGGSAPALIHHYIQGACAARRVCHPTQHNIFAIERALVTAARRYISEAGIDAELERAVGRVVRAFDPCIACATH